MEITLMNNHPTVREVQNIGGCKEKLINEQSTSKNHFIEANTTKVSLSHLKNDCIIPVFAKDNETTISHYQFVTTVQQALQEVLGDNVEMILDIRVSHVIKGRIPEAIGKPAKELLEHEKTIYYERMAFVFEIPDIYEEINGNRVNLTIGGVRAYNQENLFSKKSIEKFKVFVGYQNTVCTNLCISTDGLKADIRVSSVGELKEKILELFNNYDRQNQVEAMKRLPDFRITEEQFAHLIGKMKMYQHQPRNIKEKLFPLAVTDTQINSIVKGYHTDTDFKHAEDGTICLWKLYNLFTEANKSTYIDSNLERNVNAFEFIQYLSNYREYGLDNWFIHSNNIALR